MSHSLNDPVPVLQPQPMHILVVEDSIALRFVLAEWLRSLAYVVYEAATTDEAVTLLASSLTVDLVVTDVFLPGAMDGLGLKDYIRKAFPRMPVIVVSGAYRPGEADDALVFFRKPYDLGEISACIARMLAEQGRVNE